MLPAGVTCLALMVAAGGCWWRWAGPPPLRYDAERLRHECGIDPGGALDEKQAACVGRLAGLSPRGTCPLEVRRQEGPDGRSVFRVAEPCNEIAILVAVDGGEVVGVELGEALATPGG